MGSNKDRASRVGDPSKIIMNAAYLALSVSIIEMATGLGLGIIVLEADGLHTSIDAVILLSLYVGFDMAFRPADVDHPFGHYKYKYLAMYTVALIIIGATMALIYEASSDIINKSFERPPQVAIYVVAAVMALVASRAIYLFMSYGRLKEPVLLLEAKHAAADIVDSALVITTVVASMYVPFIEPIAALAISSYLLYLAGNYIKESMNTLLDRVDPSLSQRIIDYVNGMGISVSDVRLKNVGNGYVVDMIIKVPSKYTIGEAHDAASTVESSVKRRFPSVRGVVVHMEPDQAA
ncbi:cation transporter [Thermocladium modestius]|uniref:Cation transporter n=1 Tax=Thermocladium modestius TaxID=62609 RepID=A0A830GX28_9CREN|nr:cation diffusion facilitator family transporter [Thermocladium modestius]GGP21878.1 cation transporter [Thermocladium modestius]